MTENNSNTVWVENYANLLQQISTVLNLTQPEIREKYADYPICLMDYFEKDIQEKSIEIRFDKEEITITCTFDIEGKCIIVYLFPDTNEVIEKLIRYLKEIYNYDFINSRWTTSNYYIKVDKISRLPSDFCFIFYK